MDNKVLKWLLIIGGLVLLSLTCWIVVFSIMRMGLFRQRITQSYINAEGTIIALPPGGVVPTITVTLSAEDISSLPYLKRFELAGPDISEAMSNSSQGNYAEAAVSWTKVIDIIPDWDGGYYSRGMAYLNLIANQRSQDEYMYYLSLAGEDFDKAIEITPSNGSYYYARFRYYDALSSNQTTRVDTDYLENIALDNLLMANRLGNHEKDAEVKVALVDVAAGKCDDAIAQANRLISESSEPTVDMIGSLSRGYFCKDDTANALKYMNQVVDLVDGCQSRFDRARIFYVMGRLDDALADLDATISKSPQFCGLRYYLRGLIYVEKGELDKAQEDLMFGMGQTWERGGLLSYAQGKISLAQNDKEAAVHFFQDAVLTYSLHDPIFSKMQDDIVALGATPVEAEITVPSVTPIPTPTE